MTSDEANISKREFILFAAFCVWVQLEYSQTLTCHDSRVKSINQPSGHKSENNRSHDFGDLFRLLQGFRHDDYQLPTSLDEGKAGRFQSSHQSEV
jgi:hypothetical protein